MATLHEVATPHRLCASHGERAHVIDAPGAAPVAETGVDRPRATTGRLRRAVAELEADEHCGACLWQSAGGPFRVLFAVTSADPPAPADLPRALPPVPVLPLLSSAPKTSPPAHA